MTYSFLEVSLMISELEYDIIDQKLVLKWPERSVGSLQHHVKDWMKELHSFTVAGHIALRVLFSLFVIINDWPLQVI